MVYKQFVIGVQKDPTHYFFYVKQDDTLVAESEPVYAFYIEAEEAAKKWCDCYKPNW